MTNKNASNETEMDNVVELKPVRNMTERAHRMNAAKAQKKIDMGIAPFADPADKGRWQRLVDGELEVEDLDLEELKRMRCRDRAGGWTGRPSRNIPRDLITAIQKEYLKRLQIGIEEQAEVAIKALAEVAQKGLGKDRIAAAQILLERTLGKVPDKVDLTTHSADPWDDIIDNVLVTDDNMQKLIAQAAEEARANPAV